MYRTDEIAGAYQLWFSWLDRLSEMSRSVIIY